MTSLDRYDMGYSIISELDYCALEHYSACPPLKLIDLYNGHKPMEQETKSDEEHRIPGYLLSLLVQHVVRSDLFLHTVTHQSVNDY